MPSALAKRYGAAMLTVAHRLGIVKDTELNLLSVKEAYQKSEKFRNFMQHPKIPKKSKKEAVGVMLGTDAHPALIQFLWLLVDKGRFGMIAEIADAFDELDDKLEGIVRVSVKSFMPLDEKQESTLKMKLSVMTKTDPNKILLLKEVDPKTLGGISVRIGDELIDGTIATKLLRLYDMLTDPKFLGGAHVG